MGWSHWTFRHPSAATFLCFCLWPSLHIEVGDTVWTGPFSTHYALFLSKSELTEAWSQPRPAFLYREGCNTGGVGGVLSCSYPLTLTSTNFISNELRPFPGMLAGWECPHGAGSTATAVGSSVQVAPPQGQRQELREDSCMTVNSQQKKKSIIWHNSSLGERADQLPSELWYSSPPDIPVGHQGLCEAGRAMLICSSWETSTLVSSPEQLRCRENKNFTRQNLHVFFKTGVDIWDYLSHTVTTISNLSLLV